MFLILYFDPLLTQGKVHARNRFFTVRHFSRATGQGLFDTFKRVVEYMRTQDWKTKMVGLAVMVRMLKAILHTHCHGLSCFGVWLIDWSLIALKNSLKMTFFGAIDDLLLRINYKYAKLPKKCRELEEIVLALKPA